MVKGANVPSAVRKGHHIGIFAVTAEQEWMVKRMDDLISRKDAIDALGEEPLVCDEWKDEYNKGMRTLWAVAKRDIESLPSIDAVQVVRCKDCKHRPKRLEEVGGEGFNLEFPDYKCPCQCDDGWYNWMPDDNWFCGNGERKKE